MPCNSLTLDSHSDQNLVTDSAAMTPLTWVPTV